MLILEVVHIQFSNRNFGPSFNHQHNNTVAGLGYVNLRLSLLVTSVLLYLASLETEAFSMTLVPSVHSLSYSNLSLAGLILQYSRLLPRFLLHNLQMLES